MSYTEGYDNNFSSSKIPYDDIPISRRAPKKKHHRVSSSNFKILVTIVAVMFIINIGLCIALVYHVKNAVVKNVVVNHNNISAVGDSALGIASDTAWWSSVCVAAGGSCHDESSFYKNTRSRGSGVIYKIDEEEGVAYFITCYHVLDGHDKYYILLPSKLKPDIAELVGFSSYYDIAVLKMPYSIEDFESCTAIQVADSTYLTTGSTVIAVGNSLSGGLSVTSGIISRINTMIRVEGNTFLSREIQIDAAINPGNSGGGAFNNEGKFIGLVNAKLNTTQSGNTTINVTGTAYAIPSKLVTSIADSMILNEGAPVCVDLGAEFEYNENIGPERYEFAENRYIEDHRVFVKSAGSASSGKLIIGDEIVSFSYVDIFGFEHKDVQMFNVYSFDDIKFLIKKGSKISFKVNRIFADNPITVEVTVTGTQTY